jgi:hypothetical protein
MAAQPKPYLDERIFPATSAFAAWTSGPPGAAPEHASGPCPHCTHVTDTDLPTHAVELYAVARIQPDDSHTMTRKVSCACAGPEPRPDGVTAGCGRWWLMCFVRAADGTYSIGSVHDDALLAAARTLADASTTEQQDVASAADKWLTGISALYGLFALTGIAVAKDSLADLGGLAKFFTALAVLIGVVLAAGAIVNGYQAAYGWPRVTDVSNDAELQQWYLARQGFAGTAAVKLRTAVQAACGSLAALVLATGFIWFWTTPPPTPPTPAPLVKVQLVGGGFACGTLLSSTGKLGIRVLEAQGGVRPVDPKSVTKIDVVATCP